MAFQILEIDENRPKIRGKSQKIDTFGWILEKSESDEGPEKINQNEPKQAFPFGGKGLFFNVLADRKHDLERIFRSPSPLLFQCIMKNTSSFISSAGLVLGLSTPLFFISISCIFARIFITFTPV